MNEVVQSGGTKTVHVIQGKLHASNDSAEVLTTVLGSCVAACLHDPQARVGGMNHFLLPGDLSGSTPGESYGVNAMELLKHICLEARCGKGLDGATDQVWLRCGVLCRALAKLWVVD